MTFASRLYFIRFQVLPGGFLFPFLRVRSKLRPQYRSREVNWKLRILRCFFGQVNEKFS